MKIILLIRNYSCVFPFLSYWKAATENGNCNVSIAERDAFRAAKFRWMIAQVDEFWERRMDRGNFVVNFLHLITVIFNISPAASFVGIASNSPWDSGAREQFSNTGFRSWRGCECSWFELSSVSVPEHPTSWNCCQWDEGRRCTGGWDAEPGTCVVTLAHSGERLSLSTFPSSTREMDI